MIDIIKASAKAVTAFVVSAAALWLTRVGLTPDASFREIVETGIGAIANAVLVYLVPNKPKG